MNYKNREFKSKINIIAFDGDRYSWWKLRLRVLLNELDGLQVIDDETPEKQSDECKISNRVTKSIIVEYLSDSFPGFAKAESTTREIFKSSDVICKQKSFATQLALRKKCLGLKLRGETPLIKNFQISDDLIIK